MCTKVFTRNITVIRTRRKSIKGFSQGEPLEELCTKWQPICNLLNSVPSCNLVNSIQEAIHLKPSCELGVQKLAFSFPSVWRFLIIKKLPTCLGHFSSMQLHHLICLLFSSTSNHLLSKWVNFGRRHCADPPQTGSGLGENHNRQRYTSGTSLKQLAIKWPLIKRFCFLLNGHC